MPGKALGAYAWTAGVELACYVERSFCRPASCSTSTQTIGRLSGLRVLELGAGTGITAIALARLGARVTATDLLPDLVTLMDENISISGLRPGRCTTKAFAWGSTSPAELRVAFDLVVGSEITYNEGGFEPLVHTLSELCVTEASQSRQPPTVLLAETLRNPRQPQFWALVGQEFLAQEVFAAPQQDKWNVRDVGAPVRIFRLHARRSIPPSLAANPAF